VLFTASTRKTNRKLRLFACACVRNIWSLLDDQASRGGCGVAGRQGNQAEGISKGLIDREFHLRRDKARMLYVTGYSG
jgi:hypothetical protein